MSKYFISVDNERSARAITEILNHYFANYEMRTRDEIEGNGLFVTHTYEYDFHCYVDKETEEKVRHDISQLEVPPTLRQAADGSDYLERLVMHQ